MEPDSKNLRERFSEILELYNKAIRENRLEKAYQYILILCKATDFKHHALNDHLFTTLIQLTRYEDAYAYAIQICTDQLSHGNVNHLLYAYQTYMLLKKKLSKPSQDTLQQRIKAYLYKQVRRIKETHNLFPQQRQSRAHINIGHLIGLISPGHAPTKMLLNELRTINHKAFHMHIFTTEWAANRFFSEYKSDVLQSHYEDLNHTIMTQYKTKLFIADIHDNFLERSIQICKNIIHHNIDILIVNATDAEAITLMIAMIKPVSVMLNAVHGGPMLLDNFDGIIQLQQDDFIKDTQIPQHYIPITSDIQFDPSNPTDSKSRCAFEKVQTLKEKNIITGTFGSLFKVNNKHYIHTIGTLLQEHGNMVHIFVGWGDFDTIRNKFEAYDVADRILYLGFQKNIKPFIESIDVYCASFPYPGHTCELECMALGKPVVSMAWTEGHHFNSGARVVGLPECIAPQNNCDRYKQIAHTFISDNSLRDHVGAQLRERFNKEFSPTIRVRTLERLYNTIITSDTQGQECPVK